MKTAVEWLYTQLQMNNEILEKGTRVHQEVEKKIFDQAKEMYKDEMMNFCAIYANLISQGHPITPLEFYNETFCRQFIADNKTSSATKCICGKEKFEHI
jgi:hypothetical protein